MPLITISDLLLGTILEFNLTPPDAAPNLIQLSNSAALTPKRQRQPLDNGDRGIAHPALNITDMGAADTGFIGKGFLAQRLALAQATHIFTKALTYIQRRIKAAPSTINLQTMSDICVDCGRVWRIGAVT